MALALGAREVPGWSAAEDELARGLPSLPPDSEDIRDLKRAIRAGNDPLGEQFCWHRSAAERRKLGATYTPAAIVTTMLDWAARRGTPERVVDPGAGSGRFMLEAGRRFPAAQLLGIEVDPVASIVARANLAASGLARRSTLCHGEYQATPLAPVQGRTLFTGNPPYVRHHLIPREKKEWLVRESKKLGLKASQLAGLHVHFILATRLKAQDGDYGAFIASAEWLDVNYGKLVRELLLSELGGVSVVLMEPKSLPFKEAATTAAIMTFEVGSKRPALSLKCVENPEELRRLNGGNRVSKKDLRLAKGWSCFTRAPCEKPGGFIELGDLCRVHRGQVTGANGVWIAGPHAQGLPESVLFPAITRAKELFDAGQTLTDASRLRRVVDLPQDLDELGEDEKGAVERFLTQAKKMNAHRSYIAQNRRAWWSVGLRAPAPILATYMARRPPAFVRNAARARHLNIAHGLYPRETMSRALCCALVAYLSRQTDVAFGRTYAGGLTKFEPREMERIPIPPPSALLEGVS